MNKYKWRKSSYNPAHVLNANDYLVGIAVDAKNAQAFIDEANRMVKGKDQNIQRMQDGLYQLTDKNHALREKVYQLEKAVDLYDTRNEELHNELAKCQYKLDDALKENAHLSELNRDFYEDLRIVEERRDSLQIKTNYAQAWEKHLQGRISELEAERDKLIKSRDYWRDEKFQAERDEWDRLNEHKDLQQDNKSLRVERESALARVEAKANECAKAYAEVAKLRLQIDVLDKLAQHRFEVIGTASRVLEYLDWRGDFERGVDPVISQALDELRAAGVIGDEYHEQQVPASEPEKG